MKFINFHRSKEDRKFIKSLRNIIGLRPDNIFLYKLAFKHRSAAQEQINGLRICNERLEYLGDAVLSAIVADYLFKKFPYKDEGFLTEMRSRMVSRDNLNKLSEKLSLRIFIEHNDNSALNKSALGDTFEALIGAIYLDYGYKKAQKWVIERIIKIHIDMEVLEHVEVNFKSKLIEWVQKEKKTIDFTVVCDDESSNQRIFKIDVLVDGVSMGIGKDFSKKKAEQMAAENACKKIFA